MILILAIFHLKYSIPLHFLLDWVWCTVTAGNHSNQCDVQINTSTKLSRYAMERKQIVDVVKLLKWPNWTFYMGIMDHLCHCNPHFLLILAIYTFIADVDFFKMTVTPWDLQLHWFYQMHLKEHETKITKHLKFSNCFSFSCSSAESFATLSFAVFINSLKEITDPIANKIKDLKNNLAGQGIPMRV